MPSMTERVHRHLDADPTLRDGLGRGLLDLRRTARWLIAQMSWETTEEAVVGALRHHANDSDAITMETGRELLSGGVVGVRSGLALVTLPRDLETHERLWDVWGELDEQALLGALPGDARLGLLIEERSLNAAIRVGGPAFLREVSRPVSAIRLLFPDAEQSLAPVLSIVLHTLDQHGVETLDVFSCGSECGMLVSDSQEVLAHEVVWALTTIGRTN